MISPAQHLEGAPALIAAQFYGGPHFAPGAGVQTRTRANAKGPAASLQVDHSPVRRNQRLLIDGVNLVSLVNKLLRVVKADVRHGGIYCVGRGKCLIDLT